MKLSNLLRIINEELEEFYSDWETSDEPSIADKYYERKFGIKTPPKEPKEKIDAELVGYVTTMWGKPMEKPISVYKNPQSLKGFANSSRGVLLNNGDLYLADGENALHDDILKMLAEKGLIPLGKTLNYSTELPEEFVAVQRVFNSNTFAQSAAYEEFPVYYAQMFDEANSKSPHKFNKMDVTEQLDPNYLISYKPDGYQHNILDEG